MKDICMKKIKLTLAVLIAFLMTGCYPSGGELLSNEDNGAISEQIEDIVSGNENLDIDVTLAENVLEAPEINVKVMEWDEETLKSVFLSEKGNPEYSEYPSDNFPNDLMRVYIYEENENQDAYWLVSEPGRLTAEIRESKYGYGSLASSIYTYNFRDLFGDNDLQAFTKSDAINRANALLTELGITNYSKPNIYSITADEANKYLNQNFSNSHYESWTKENEIYILSYPLEYENIPITINFSSGGTVGGHGSFFVGSCIDVIVTKDDIFSLQCENILNPNYEKGESVSINCNAQNALKIAAEHYNGMVLEDDDIKISDCQLVYVPFEQDKKDEKCFTLIPMWKIDAVVYGNNTDLMGTCDYLFIDAQTGNIIIW